MTRSPNPIPTPPRRRRGRSAARARQQALPARGRPRGTGGKAKELTPEEIHRIDRLLEGTRHEKRNRALFYLGLGTGMRISEIVGLEVEDVLSRGRVRNRIVLEKHSTKSKRSRTVAVSRQAVQHLQTYLKARFPTLSRASGPLFPSQKKPKQPMSSTNAILTLKRMFAAAGVASKASSHSLRRTHANTLRRNGVDLKVIQEQLGHSSLAITDRYFQVDPLEAQRAVEMLRF